MNRIQLRVTALLLGVGAVSCTALAAPTEAQPRIGVGGALRMGFGGILLRAGIPFTYLTRDEQCNLETLQGYDLILQAGMDNHREPWKFDAEAALDRYVHGGGKLICEAQVRLPLAMKGWKLDFDWPMHWPLDRGDRNFTLAQRPAAGSAGFCERLQPGETWVYGGPLCKTSQLPRDVSVLAVFSAGPAAGQPAVVSRPYGAGKFYFLAGQISYMQGNWRPAYDDLVLAAAGDLTGGRVHRIWAAEAGDAVPPPAVPEPAAAPALDGYHELGASGTGGYALKVRLGGASQSFVLDHCAGGDLRLTVGAGQAQVQGGRTSLDCRWTPAKELVVVRSARRLVLAVDGLGVGSVPLAQPPAGTVLAASGSDATLQPLEPLYFADDFTKQSPLVEPWRAWGGPWFCGGPHRIDSAIAGFAVRGWNGGARTGEWFWSEYRAAASVQPRSAQAVELALGGGAEGQRPLRLWLPVGHGTGALRGPQGGAPLLHGLPNLPIRQWSRVSAAVRDGQVAVTVNGITQTAPFDKPSPGPFGWRVAHGDALFDDVEVSDASDDELRLRPVHPSRYDKGKDGLLDRDTWAHSAAAWLTTAVPGRFVHAGLVCGDFRLAVPLRDLTETAALRVGLDGESAQRPLLSLDSPRLHALAQQGAAGVVLTRHDGKLSATAGSQELEVAAPAGRADRLWLQFGGLTLAASDLDLQAEGVLEYVADQAPAAFWETQGEWTVGSRWPCSPQWAWMTGVSTQVAALWTKARYGDRLAVVTCLGPRMQGEYATNEGEALRRLRVTLGGDGRDPYHGYIVEIGGDVDNMCRLYRGRGHDREWRPRDEDVVASCSRELAGQREIHNWWGNVRIERDGPRIQVTFQGRPLLDYTDPEPLKGPGSVALWTFRNGLVTPYVAVYGTPLPDALKLDGKVQQQRLAEYNNRLARPGFNPLPAMNAIARLLGWETS